VKDKSQNVVVAMSGGVDSSVAAALLKEKGHRVTGVTLRLLAVGAGFGCCGSSSDVEDALAVCRTLDVPHYVLNFSAEFQNQVREPFVRSYLAGETPNPCIACNRFIKFDALLKKARALGADLVATGHYARVVSENGRFSLRRARDRAKDQSYVLHHLGQDELSRLTFPVGDMTKAQVRAAAGRYGLKVADKKESMEICFIPDRDWARYVSEAAPKDAATTKPGSIVDSRGRVLGVHKGTAFYTVGQREGLGLSTGQPVYVVDLDPATNTVVVGPDEETRSRRFIVDDLAWPPGGPPSETFPAEVQIRAHSAPKPCAVRVEGPRAFVDATDAPLRAVTPGQSAVFYRGDEVIGGGTIRRGRC
jgi:tRNA-uridine 2-sulfurtransferase